MDLIDLKQLGAAGARGFLRRGEAPPVADPALPRKATLLSVPLFHATGCHSILQGAVAAGSKLVRPREGHIRVIWTGRDQLYLSRLSSLRT